MFVIPLQNRALSGITSIYVRLELHTTSSLEIRVQQGLPSCMKKRGILSRVERWTRRCY